MYVRGVKQFIKAAEPDFDERAYGFSGLLDALRQVQKAGVLRLERNRQGVLRIFPGEVIERSAASVQESLVESSAAGATLSDATESVAGDDKAAAQAGVEAGVGDDKAPIVATKTKKTTKKAVSKKKTTKKKVTATKKATAVKKKTTRKTTKKVAKKEETGSGELEVDGNK